MSRAVRIALVATSLALACPLIPWAVSLAAGRAPDGLRIAAEPIEVSQPLAAQVRQRARAWGRAEVTVDGGRDVLRTVTRAQLGARVDIERMTQEAQAYGHSGDPLSDVPALVSAWTGAADLAWTVRIDRPRVVDFVDELAAQIDRPARPATLHEGRLLELSADGARLDHDAAVQSILRALKTGGRSVRLPVTAIPSGVGDAALAARAPPVTPPVLIARYATDLETRGGERPRAHNVATAAGYLDGAIIPAGGRLSFNERVQERSFSRGYRMAHVIRDGEMVDGIGGGVCQVASTLHAAAFLGGLEIVEHRPHSRPSAYIPMGLDATVVWPNVDLVLDNPFPFPITVRARSRGGEMVVELFGARRPARVDWERRTLATEPWADRYVEDPEVPPGGRRVSQRGIRGFTIERSRTVRDGRGVHIQHRRLVYPPTRRVIRVPLGTLDPNTGEPFEDETRRQARLRAAEEAPEPPNNPF